MNNNNICKFSNVCSSDLVCSNFIYEETDIQSKPTYTDNYIMGFIVGGCGILNQNDGKFIISKGDAFFIQKNSNFSIEKEDNIVYFYISFYGRRADELVERFDLSDASCVFNLSDDYQKITEFAFDCLKKANLQNTDLFAETVLIYLLAHLNIKKGKSNNLLAEIIKLTNENFTDPSFSLSKLATFMGYDVKYLSFFFKKNKGMYYSQYLKELRIKRSVFLMEQGITSVKNVAILSGFNDALYYSKVFKKETGKSPKDYMSNLIKT